MVFSGTPEIVGGLPRLDRNSHVLKGAQSGEDIGDLVGRRDSLMGNGMLRKAGDILTPEPDLSFRRGKVSGDHLKEGALTRSVWTDNRLEASLLQNEIDPIHSGETAKMFSQKLCSEDFQRFPFA